MDSGVGPPLHMFRCHNCKTVRKHESERSMGPWDLVLRQTPIIHAVELALMFERLEKQGKKLTMPHNVEIS